MHEGPDPRGATWQIGNNGNPIDPRTKYEAVSALQSSFRNNPNNQGNLEVAALSSDGRLLHFCMDSGSKKLWNGPYDFSSFQHLQFTNYSGSIVTKLQFPLYILPS